MASAEATVKDLEKRVEDLEHANERNHEWKRGPVLMVAVGSLTIFANVVIALWPH